MNRQTGSIRRGLPTFATLFFTPEPRNEKNRICFITPVERDRTGSNTVTHHRQGQKIIEGQSAELFDPTRTIVELETTNNDQCLSILQQSQWQQCLQPLRNQHIILKTERSRLPDLHRWIVNNHIGLISLQPRHTLEDFFLQVTSGNQHVEAFTN